MIGGQVALTLLSFAICLACRHLKQAMYSVNMLPFCTRYCQHDDCKKVARSPEPMLTTSSLAMQASSVQRPPAAGCAERAAAPMMLCSCTGADAAAVRWQQEAAARSAAPGAGALPQASAPLTPTCSRRCVSHRHLTVDIQGLVWRSSSASFANFLYMSDTLSSVDLWASALGCPPNSEPRMQLSNLLAQVRPAWRLPQTYTLHPTIAHPTIAQADRRGSTSRRTRWPQCWQGTSTSQWPRCGTPSSSISSSSRTQAQWRGTLRRRSSATAFR
jgi:hypothetical protein